MIPIVSGQTKADSASISNVTAPSSNVISSSSESSTLPAGQTTVLDLSSQSCYNKSDAECRTLSGSCPSGCDIFDNSYVGCANLTFYNTNCTDLAEDVVAFEYLLEKYDCRLKVESADSESKRHVNVVRYSNNSECNKCKVSLIPSELSQVHGSSMDHVISVLEQGAELPS